MNAAAECEKEDRNGRVVEEFRDKHNLVVLNDG